MEDVSTYFLLQLMLDECKPMTKESHDKLSDGGKKKLAIGSIPVSYFKMTGKMVDGIPEFELSLQFTSLTNALIELKDKDFIELRASSPVVAF